MTGGRPHSTIVVSSLLLVLLFRRKLCRHDDWLDSDCGGLDFSERALWPLQAEKILVTSHGDNKILGGFATVLVSRVVRAHDLV